MPQRKPKAVQSSGTTRRESTWVTTPETFRLRIYFAAGLTGEAFHNQKANDASHQRILDLAGRTMRRIEAAYRRFNGKSPIDNQFLLDWLVEITGQQPDEILDTHANEIADRLDRLDITPEKLGSPLREDWVVYLDEMLAANATIDSPISLRDLGLNLKRTLPKRCLYPLMKLKYVESCDFGYFLTEAGIQKAKSLR